MVAHDDEFEVREGRITHINWLIEKAGSVALEKYPLELG